MRISTLSIGDELICGEVTDTNAGTIAATLLNEGLRIQRHLAVGDNEQDIIGALNDLGRISDAVIITGGLGPTADDMTSRAAARSTGRRLIINEVARNHVRRMSEKLENLIVCPLGDKQAMIPTKSALIPNPNGTACGFHLMHNGCFMFFMPGVPSEMLAMLKETVIPFITARVPQKRSIRSFTLNIFGPCEAEVDELLLGIAKPEHGLTLGICVTFPSIRVTLRAEAENPEAATGLLQAASDLAIERLKDYCYSTGETGMDEAVAALFRENSMTLSLAESCSGGLISKRITDIPGSSGYFLEGLVTYSNSAKTRLLEIDTDILNRYGAVSSECASAMAKGVRKCSGADIGLAVTGIAGPNGVSEEKPAGTVFISLAASDGCWTKRFQFNGNRDEIRTLTAWTSLDWLRRYLLKH
ncbi:MAG: CinA family nicotinamide mononucleotide deamidase-related protein [Desulfuromonadaceae bacterium]|nr:CinA family nicotinamide mononucleotide deamidase-related protein [Desulfuromonadaceae bacterium]MDD2856413.1 CinA family nicotinamide mononucleotide deamidase-related protein [Desulfuromonadaceae bacterium]